MGERLDWFIAQDLEGLDVSAVAVEVAFFKNSVLFYSIIDQSFPTLLVLEINILSVKPKSVHSLVVSWPEAELMHYFLKIGRHFCLKFNHISRSKGKLSSPQTSIQGRHSILQVKGRRNSILDTDHIRKFDTGRSANCRQISIVGSVESLRCASRVIPHSDVSPHFASHVSVDRSEQRRSVHEDVQTVASASATVHVELERVRGSQDPS